MDREKFIYSLEKESANINEKRLIELVQRSIDSNLSDGNPRGGECPTVCCVEKAVWLPVCHVYQYFGDPV